MSETNGNSSGNGRVEAMEQRIHRLEDAVTALQDTRQLENRLVDRIVERVGRGGALASPSGSRKRDSARSLVPAAAINPVEVRVPPPIPAPPANQTWFLLDAYHEVRTFFRMFLDARYRVSRGMLPMCIGLLIAIGTSWLWFPPSYLPLVGATLTRIVDLVLAYVLFKLLSREARRYRSTFPDEAL
jgi:hypothetical protein